MANDATDKCLRALLDHEYEEGYLTQEIYDALQVCEDWTLLADLTLGAVEGSMRWASWGRLSSLAYEVKTYQRERRDDTVDALERVAKGHEERHIRNTARGYATVLGKRYPSRYDFPAPTDLEVRMSAFNPKLGAFLQVNRDNRNLADSHTLDLIEYAVWLGRDDYATAIARRPAAWLYDLLPPDRQAHVDGKKRDYPWWNPYAERYFLAKSLVETESDAGLLEWGSIHATAFELRRFAFARLSGWRGTDSEDDFESYCTFECARLEGYPLERLSRLLENMVKLNKLDEELAQELLEKAQKEGD